MKNLLLLLLISLYSFAFPQSESDILWIRTKVEKTNLDSKNYNTSKMKTQEASAEGNEIILYTEQLNDIKLIKETYFGEMGKTVIWDYIENNHPYFIFKEYYTYTLPITYKSFNTANFTKTEERFYLKNDRVIRWMKDKKILKTYPKNAASIENNMIDNINGLIEKFNTENKE